MIMHLSSWYSIKMHKVHAEINLRASVCNEEVRNDLCRTYHTVVYPKRYL